MRVVMISDTHSFHHRVGPVPDGDVLIHAGDFMNSGREISDVIRFNAWFGDQPHRHKILIAGNHDRMMESHRSWCEGLLTSAIYLEDSGCMLDGFRFWGSPFQPEFCNWAFNEPRGAAMRRHWELIPDDTDVLITHGPPFGIRDWVHLGAENLGCEDLLQAVQRIKPQIHVFGHIHGGRGIEQNEDTLFVNASFLDETYQRWPRELTVVDLETPRFPLSKGELL